MSSLLMDEIQLKSVTDLLPVCAWCTRVRDEQQNWHPASPKRISYREITHTICPKCFGEMISMLGQS